MGTTTIFSSTRVAVRKPENFPVGWRWEDESGVGRLKMPGGEFFRYVCQGTRKYGGYILYQRTPGSKFESFIGSLDEFRKFAEGIMRSVIDEHKAIKSIKSIVCLCGVIGCDESATRILGYIVKAQYIDDRLVLSRHGKKAFVLPPIKAFRIWDGNLVVHCSDASYVFLLGKEKP